MLFGCCFSFGWLVWCYVGLELWVSLLQENSGETCKSRPSEPVSPRRDEQGFAQTLLRERSPRRPAYYFERASISPRREGSRLSEIPRCPLDVFFEPSPRRRGLAWARPFSLSEGLDETMLCLVAWLLSVEWNCLGMIAMMRYMYICMYICLMDCYVCVTWFMNGEWWILWDLGMWNEWVDLELK